LFYEFIVEKLGCGRERRGLVERDEKERN